MPRLHWQPIKNLLRLHSLRLQHNFVPSLEGPYSTARWHYLWVPVPDGLIGLEDWKLAPDPQAFIMARIANAAWRKDNAR